MKSKLINYLLKAFGGIILLFLFSFSLNYYSHIRVVYSYDSFELKISRMTILIIFNLIFFSLFFIIGLGTYKTLFIYLSLYGIFLWILQYFSFIFGENDLNFPLDIFFSIMLFMTYNIVAPGLILYTINYIQKISSKTEGNLWGKFHIHEDFFGLILLGISLILFIFRLYLIQYRIFWNELRIILAIFNVSIFIFLFFGSFFFFRDIRDVFKLKFIERVETKKYSAENNYNTSVFLNIKHSSIPFYRKLNIPLYPIGIFFTNFAFNMVIYGSDFLITDIFHLEYNNVVSLGYLLLFLTAGLIGLDWVRIFEKFYPKKYEELMETITKFEN